MGQLPADIRRFLYDNVETLEELELLVLLGRDPSRTWSKDEAETELKIPFHAVADAFQSLYTVGLCDLLVGPDREDRFRLTLHDPRRAAKARELAQLYHASRFELVKLIAEAAMDRVRSSVTRAFADAFVIGDRKKKRGPDG